MTGHRTIIIEACVFGGRYGATVQPRTVDWPMREFREYHMAKSYAAGLADERGWLIVDKVEGAHG